MYTLFGYANKHQLGANTTTTMSLPFKMYNAYNVVEISAGHQHSAILRGDGIPFAVGYGANGQTGLNTTADKAILTAMKNGKDAGIMKNIASLQVGGNHTVALTETGEIYVTGLNSNAQLSQEGTTPSSILIPALYKNEAGTNVPLKEITYISAGYTNTFALTKSGEVYAAGYNNYGQLGQGNNATPINLFAKVKDQTGTGTLQNIDYVVRGSRNTQNAAFIANDGTVYTCRNRNKWGTCR